MKEEKTITVTRNDLLNKLNELRDSDEHFKKLMHISPMLYMAFFVTISKIFDAFSEEGEN